MPDAVFDPEAMVRMLETNPVAGFRELAAALDRGDMKAFDFILRGNGLLEERWGRVVFDIRFSLEVSVRKSLP